MLSARFLPLLTLLLAVFPLPCSAATSPAGALSDVDDGEVYVGEGRAVLGSSMTPTGTKDLAFEKARQAALEKFGAHVRSKQTLQSVETPGGTDEVSKTRIAVLAAGNASVVDGSKEILREPTEETIVYRARAKFRIEPTDFEKTLKAYQSAGGDSRLRQSVETAVDLQERLTRVDPGADTEEVRRLLSEAEGSYDAISAAVRDLGGGELRSDIAKKRQRRKNALLRYLQDVKRHGYPGDLLSLRLEDPQVSDEGEYIELTYEAGHEKTSGRQKIFSAYRQTRPTWWPSEVNPLTYSRRLDGWLEQVFDHSSLTVRRPVLLYMLDENGNVLLMATGVEPVHQGDEAPIAEFDFLRVSKEDLPDIDWEDEWTVEVPTEYVGEISSTALLISTENYKRLARRNGFKKIDQNLWARGGGRPLSLKRFAYSRESFEKQVDSWMSKAKSLPPNGQ